MLHLQNIMPQEAIDCHLSDYIQLNICSMYLMQQPGRVLAKFVLSFVRRKAKAVLATKRSAKNRDENEDFLWI